MVIGALYKEQKSRNSQDVLRPCGHSDIFQHMACHLDVSHNITFLAAYTIVRNTTIFSIQYMYCQKFQYLHQEARVDASQVSTFRNIVYEFRFNKAT